jgi:hypothetical protein
MSATGATAEVRGSLIFCGDAIMGTNINAVKIKSNFLFMMIKI